MKKSLRSVVSHGQFGMPGSHIEAVLEVAKSLNLVIGIKKVSEYSLSFLEQGCPTKSDKLKTKTTSKASVVAGLIPLNPLYSHVEKNEYEKYRDQLKNDFNNDPALFSTPCVLSENRINELQILFADTITVTPAKNQYSISWQKQDTLITVTAKKNSYNNDYTIYDRDDQIILVVGREVIDADGKKVSKPVTSDYDLLVICPEFDDLELWGKDKTHSANLNERSAHVLQKINHEIAKRDINRQGIHLEVVHHGDEFHNPLPSEIASNLPSLFVLPREIQLPEQQTNVVLVETVDELQKICETIVKNNYYVSPHPKHPGIGVRDHATSLCRGYVIIQSVLLFGQQVMGDGWVGIATLNLFM